MATIPQQHYRYADALIGSAVKAFARNGNKTKKSEMIAGAKSAERSSLAAAIKHDKKLRPNSPKAWNTATAIKVNKSIQDIVWKEVRSAYRKVRRKKASIDHLNDHINTETMLASMFGLGAVSGSGATKLNRRTLILGATVITAASVTVGVKEAWADNNAYIGAVKRDIRAYVKGKRSQIEKSLAAAIK